MRFCGLILCCLLFPAISLAKGLSPYLPLQLSPEIESQVEKVMALTPGAPLTKPYKAADVLARLPQLQSSHPGLYKKVSRYLERFKRRAGRSHSSLELATGQESKTLPNRRGIDAQSSYVLAAGGFYQPNPYIIASAGMVMTDDSGGPIHTNSYIGFGFEYAQVEFGYREHWFSPFRDSAMLVSTQAQASPSITISNATPITDWNIRYELFYSKLERVEGIRLGNEFFAGHPRQAGLHLSFTPLNFWTLGVSRTFQFGGGAREVDISDVFQALFDPAGKDNVGTVTDDPNFEFGNQQASFTSKLNIELWDINWSFYGEIGGEDTEGEKNYKLGNETLSFGIFLPDLTDEISLRVEYNRWDTRWYVHHLYRQGYTNLGNVMGHWGGDERIFNDDPPAKVLSASMEYLLNNQSLVSATLRTIKNEDTARFDYVPGFEVELDYSYATDSGFWGVSLYAGRDTRDNDFSRLALFYRW
ncbi:capsule assembly Wzi family protein [Lacimicrobium sp. SS2-24]|uniref:capsule assembly Wzi family protein n=1 Tax=Lacimicrobium sp. SS2-24 TaxID=2005569 RepID=UPI000B4AD86E|nr:capsule assembly Wzi family protein [Lacimicrobium sp. SS2-24]